jgi:hypothetical protein
VFPGRPSRFHTGAETTQRSRWASSIVSGLILLALVAAAALFYWRITASYSTAATTRRSAGPVAQPAPTPITVPSVLGSLTISSKVDFKCTVPLTAYSRRARVSLPTGTVTLDGDQSSVATSPGTSYVGGRWLPVPVAWVSPDGKTFASSAAAVGSSREQSLILTNSRSGERQEVWRGASRPTVLGWDTGGLYFMLQPPSSTGSSASDGGLWVADPSRPGQAHRVPQSTSLASTSPARAVFSTDTKVGGGGAWATAEAVGGNGARVERMDLRTGTVSAWYTAPAGNSVFILGFDARGHPVLALTGSDRSATRALMLLTGVNQTVSIADNVTGASRFATAFGDSEGVWLGASGSLWLYRSGSLFKVADIPVGAIGAQTPMPIDNATGTSGQLPPPRVVGPCV